MLDSYIHISEVFDIARLNDDDRCSIKLIVCTSVQKQTASASIDMGQM